MWNLPKQKLYNRERNDAWKTENIDYYSTQAAFYTQDRDELISLYKAASGIIDLNSYKYVLNPYNSSSENIKAFPAQMRNMDIIVPILNLFMGEKAGKLDTKQVVCVNPDVPNKMMEELNKEFADLMAQDFVNALNAQGMETGVPTQEVPDYQSFIDYKKVSYVDKRAIMGQEAYDYLKYNLDLKDNYQTGFFDWLTTNRVYSYKYIVSNDVKFEIVPALEMWHGTTMSGFVEDAAWATRKFRLTSNETLDRLKEFLSDEDVTWLDEQTRHDNGTISSITQTNNIDTRGDNRTVTKGSLETGLIDIFHCTWKTFVPYQILTYTNPYTGEVEEMEVDEDYKLNEEAGDISLETLWGNQVWEGYKMGERVLLKSVRPLAVQRNEINDSSICKLPYNGRVDLKPSVVKTLLNYQALYNIYNFRGELTLARNKDKMMLMPKGLLPPGWTPDKWMYYAETTGIMWFDETAPNAAQVLQAIKAIDMGLGNYVESMRNLMRDVKDEAWDSVGMNRQRYGDVKASDGKGNNEQAIIRSSVISREMFRKFERFEETDAQGLIEYSKEAWKNGKKGAYVRSDGSHAILNIDGSQYPDTELGIFAKDAEEEARKLETGKTVANTFAQKGVIKGSTVLEIVDSNNFSKLKAIVRKAEEIEEKLKQDQAEADRQSQENIANATLQAKQAEAEIKKYTADMQYKATVDSAQIKAGADLQIADMGQEIENTTESNVSTIRDQFNKNQQLGLQADKQNAEARNKEAQINVKREDIASKEKIAKQNKNKYDK